MKKLLLIVGIVSIVACVLFLLLAALNLFGYRHVLDGTAELYDKLHQRMILHFGIGIGFAVIGTVCMLLRSKV